MAERFPRWPYRAARCRFAVAESATARVVVRSEGGFVLYLDGQVIGRSSPDRVQSGAWFARSLTLQPGEHELFAHYWGESRPELLIQSDLPAIQRKWEASEITGVESGEAVRTIFTGEPTNPEGFGRPGTFHRDGQIGASLIEKTETYSLVSEQEIFTYPLPAEPLILEAGEQYVFQIALPAAEYVVPHLRLSGSPGSSVEVEVRKDDSLPGTCDRFEPQGFKQDFWSWEPMTGRLAEVRISSGERTLALFNLSFWGAI
ncbi:MAG: hypothetical protein C4320_06800 [Armatimonadota bacterium]